MQRLSSWLKAIDNISEYSGRVVSFLSIGLVVAITYEVVARYGFNSPTEWAYETAIFFFGAYIILGGAYTLRQDGHVKVDILYGFLSPRRKALFDLLTFWLFFSFCGILVWKGWQFGWTSLLALEHTDTAWSPPIYFFKMTLPVGATLIFLQGVAKFLRDLIFVVTGKEVP